MYYIVTEIQKPLCEHLRVFRIPPPYSYRETLTFNSFAFSRKNRNTNPHNNRLYAFQTEDYWVMSQEINKRHIDGYEKPVPEDVESFMELLTKIGYNYKTKKWNKEYNLNPKLV